jgi:hypothetical protein
VLPFTRDQFLNMFGAYNATTLPVLVFAYVLGGICIYAILQPSRRTDVLVAVSLSMMWLWTGIVYHGLYFSQINPLAVVFGLGFVVQGLWIIWETRKRRLAFGSLGDAAANVGWGLILYSLVLYPVIGSWSGHAYPDLPMFGITPCPLTLFTFGLFLLTRQPLPLRLLILPVIWSLIGGSAAFLLDIMQDWPLLFSGGLSFLMLLTHRRTRKFTSFKA